MKTLAKVPQWCWWALGVTLLIVQIKVLYIFGQPLTSTTGQFLLWVGDIHSAEMSQQLSDWYSFSHIIHGFLFFWFLTWILPRAPLGARILLAMGIEIGWEILENTPMVIHAYRQQALAAGYVGDSILNSVSDTVMMIIGFAIAWRFNWRWVLALAIALELFCGFMIRDNLTLNILNFAYPIQAVHDWQAGAK